MGHFSITSSRVAAITEQLEDLSLWVPFVKAVCGALNRSAALYAEVEFFTWLHVDKPHWILVISCRSSAPPRRTIAIAGPHKIDARFLSGGCLQCLRKFSKI